MFTKAYIFDIDGTLADNDHRLQYITNYPNDFRKDDIVKKEIYDEYIKPYEVVVGVFEDRNRCVKMWRDLGLTCYQPKETE